MEGCEFALCPREAEVEVWLNEATVVLACALHVSPVLSWGQPHPIEPARIRALADPSAR